MSVFLLVGRELDPIGTILVLLLIALYMAICPSVVGRDRRARRSHQEFRG